MPTGCKQDDRQAEAASSCLMAGTGRTFQLSGWLISPLIETSRLAVPMSSPDAHEANFRRLYHSHYSQIAAYARRRVDPHDADDVVAETFLIAWRRLEDIPSGDLELAWLYSVARRVISQGNRSGRRRERLLARLAQLKGPDVVVDETESLADREVVHLALGRLRPDDRELLRLSEWEGLSSAQLALVFGCSTNAAAIRLHRAHRRFRRALDALDGVIDLDARREVAT